MNRTVVIAGGGPTGLMLAAELGLAGVPVVVVERFAEPSGYSRSLTLQARSLEIFAQRGLDWFGDYPTVPAYNFGLVELSELVDRRLLPLFVPQRHVERLLEKRAVELGAEIRRGEDVVGFTQDESGVTVTVRPAGGPDYQLTGAYLVGCDGGSSTVRKLAGIGFPGVDSTANGLTADVITSPDVRERLGPTLYPRGLFAAIPVEPGQFRVTSLEMGVPKTSNDVEPTVAEFQASIRRVAGIDLEILHTGEVRWLSRFGNATRLAEQYRSGRVFLAGDACHIHLPVSGQGLNTGIQDAVNLGWKLAADLNGWAPPGLLDTYHAERHPVGERVCMNTRAQDALMHPLDRMGPMRELFGELVRLEAVSTYLIEMVTGISVHYPMDGSGPDRDGSPLLGRRLPDRPLTTAAGATSTAHTLQSGRGVLLRLGAAGPADPAGTADAVAGLAAGWADRVEVVAAAGGVDPAAGLDTGTLLVRPDGYVAFADPTGADRDGLRGALTGWFGEPGSER